MKKEKDTLQLCFKYNRNCKSCPRNFKCDMELKGDEMKKTCSHCGVVDINHVCPYKKKFKRETIANDIRKTYRWTKKSKAIKQRDNYLCRVCLLNKYNTMYKYNTKNLSVHHIIPLEEDQSKAFDDNNLITLCGYHHELAESGVIPKSELLSIVNNQIDL